MPVLGTITIGQSPRVDLIPEMQPVLGAGVDIIEGGALDGLGREEIARMAPAPGDYVLVTRLQDGSSVKIAEKYILPRMQAQINRVVDMGAEVVALVCTGEFPEFRCARPLIEPQRVLGHVVRSVSARLPIGIVVPDADQVQQAQERWADAASRVEVVAASPYGDQGELDTTADALRQLDAAADELRRRGCRLGVLDCIGFTVAQKKRFSTRLGAPVVLARTALARVLAEILA